MGQDGASWLACNFSRYLCNTILWQTAFHIVFCVNIVELNFFVTDHLKRFKNSWTPLFPTSDAAIQNCKVQHLYTYAFTSAGNYSIVLFTSIIITIITTAFFIFRANQAPVRGIWHRKIRPPWRGSLLYYALRSDWNLSWWRVHMVQKWLPDLQWREQECTLPWWCTLFLKRQCWGLWLLPCPVRILTISIKHFSILSWKISFFYH